jgi:hypothetical protein
MSSKGREETFSQKRATEEKNRRRLQARFALGSLHIILKGASNQDNIFGN